MKTTVFTILVLLLALFPKAHAQDPSDAEAPTFESAAATVKRQLEESLEELSMLRRGIAEEKIPLSRWLNELEVDLINVRLEYQKTSRLLDSRTLDLTNLRTEIKSRQDETTYISNLLGEYIRNFESRLHITELQRYEEPLDAAKLAAENSNLTEQEVFQAQTALLAVSLERLHDALGGSRFEGTAVDSSGLVKQGTFVLVGPAALFRSSDGEEVGTAEQRLGSLEPAAIGFANPQNAQESARVVTHSSGFFPLDPTLGNAHKVESTKESLWEHIQKGGAVMVPIFVLAGAAFLVALYKWLSLAFLRKPSKQKVQALLDAVKERDEEGAKRKVAEIKGPVGMMLAAGVDHMKESKDLIEEVMYEKVLTTRFKLQSFLPFIAICAASAPLLGLLGTVTGIISTFKLITLFGSGDVKTLSGGISEALITTEFGLIVAIPSLLLHAFLSRKARGVIGHMETTAIAFVNNIRKATHGVPLFYKAGEEKEETYVKTEKEIAYDAGRLHESHFEEDVRDDYSSGNELFSSPRSMDSSSDSSEHEVKKSIHELNVLREQIGQIAMGDSPREQEIDTLEEKMDQLRREHEEVARLAHAGSQELATLREAIKARKNEDQDQADSNET